MSRVTSFFNRVLALVLLLSSGARLAVARILPFSQATEEPAAAKVFALTEAAWQELRAGGAVSAQQKDESNNAQPKQESSKEAKENNQPTKDAGTEKDPSKNPECQEPAAKPGDDSKTSQAEEKAKDGAKPECESPGGGDGDMGGTGG